jgi:hypothetical protein
MKLLNFVFALSVAAMPVVAAASNQENVKHGDVKSIFVVSEDEGFLNRLSKHQVSLEDHYLLGASNRISSNSKPENREQFSDGSFQSKMMAEYKFAEGNNGSRNHKDLTEASSNYFSPGTSNNEHSHSEIVGFDEHLKNIDNDHHEWESHPVCTPVPEPTTYALLLAGLIMLGFAKRRKS